MGQQSSVEAATLEKKDATYSGLGELYYGSKGKAAVTVFKYSRTEHADTAIKWLKTIRQKEILRFLASVSQPDNLLLITENAVCLSSLCTETGYPNISPSVSLVCIQQLLKALAFLHDVADVAHNNVVLSSVFVREGDVSFCLGCFEECREKGEKEKDLKQLKELVSRLMVEPPEVLLLVLAELPSAESMLKHSFFTEDNMLKTVEFLEGGYRGVDSETVSEVLLCMKLSQMPMEMVGPLLLRQDLFIDVACDRFWRIALNGPSGPLLWQYCQPLLKTTSRPLLFALLRRIASFLQVCSPEAVWPTVLRCLRDTDITLVRAGFEAFPALCKDPLLATTLYEALQKLVCDSDHRVRALVPTVLHHLHHFDLSLIMLGALSDRDNGVVISALHAFPTVLPKLSLQSLSACLMPKLCVLVVAVDEDVRCTAHDTLLLCLEHMAQNTNKVTFSSPLPSIMVWQGKAVSVDPALPFVRGSGLHGSIVHLENKKTATVIPPKPQRRVSRRKLTFQAIKRESMHSPDPSPEPRRRSQTFSNNNHNNHNNNNNNNLDDNALNLTELVIRLSPRARSLTETTDEDRSREGSGASSPRPHKFVPIKTRERSKSDGDFSQAPRLPSKKLVAPAPRSPRSLVLPQNNKTEKKSLVLDLEDSSGELNQLQNKE